MAKTSNYENLNQNFSKLGGEMRKKMKSISGQRERFRATFSRTGTKKNYHGFPEITLLFDDVYREKNGQLITDHLWFNNTKPFQAINLEAGYLVEFDARVTPYVCSA